jgi:NitT/TauT family transport system ATP-binding protein
MHLEVNHVTKQFPAKRGPLVALEDISLRVESGELVCAVGASGSGKSTLLRLIAGLDTPTRGQILIDGAKVIGPGSDRGMVFQKYSLYPWLTVAENISFGLQLQNKSAAQIQEAVRYYLNVVGLTQFSQAYPRELSGGMQQRVAIARSLANQPQILLMDEPFGALDIQTKEMMQEFLLQLWQETKTTILMITHDVEEAVFLAERIYVLSAHPGTILKELTITLPDHADHGIKRHPTFRDYCDQIMDLMREGVSERAA